LLSHSHCKWILQRLLDQFVQNWQTSLSDSSKTLHYRIFKTKFEFEEYFNILNIGDAIRLCRFRTTNHYLPIETGRWRENRYCNLCNCQNLDDEYHYVLECSSLNDKRKQLLPKYYMKRHNVVKFCELLSTKKQSLLRKLCIFIKHINGSIPNCRIPNCWVQLADSQIADIWKILLLQVE
jgi:hypothetical protein